MLIYNDPDGRLVQDRLRLRMVDYEVINRPELMNQIPKPYQDCYTNTQDCEQSSGKIPVFESSPAPSAQQFKEERVLGTFFRIFFPEYKFACKISNFHPNVCQ